MPDAAAKVGVSGHERPDSGSRIVRVKCSGATSCKPAGAERFSFGGDACIDSAGPEPQMPSLSLRINLDPDGRIGPGKIELLENIAAFGSISAAARRMDMSYKHAWDLVEELNRLFGKPVVAAQTGGKKGGGAQLTAVGLSVVARFRAIERAAAQAAEPHVVALQAEIDAT